MSNAAIFGLKRRAWVAEEAFERLDPPTFVREDGELRIRTL